MVITLRTITKDITYDISQLVSSVTLSGTDTQVSRTCDINFVNAPYDANIQKLGVIPSAGDIVTVIDGSATLFEGQIYCTERTSTIGTYTINCFDYANHLLKSSNTYVFKKKTPEQIAKMVCNDVKIETGSIANTGLVIPSMICQDTCLYDVIMQAYTKAYKSNGIKYMIDMKGTKLSVIKKGEILDKCILSDTYNIENASISENISDMVNRVKIYDDKNKCVGTVQKSEWINKYGIFLKTYTKEDGVSPKSGANALIKGKNQTINIDAIGDNTCVSGKGVLIYDSATKLTGVYYIVSDSHTYENGYHKMSLEVSFKCLMEEMEVEESEDKNDK